MDKKNYFEPEMEVVELELEAALLDASPKEDENFNLDTETSSDELG